MREIRYDPDGLAAIHDVFLDAVVDATEDYLGGNIFGGGLIHALLRFRPMAVTERTADGMFPSPDSSRGQHHRLVPCHSSTIATASHITKDDIWEYLYGVMHAPDWRERYRHDLQRNLPRVPLADDFEAFRAAGVELFVIHADYDNVPEHEHVRCLVDGTEDFGQNSPEVYQIKDKMRWRDKGIKTTLAVNDHCWLTDIPPEAHQYQVSGRSPLDWAVDQLQVKSYKVGTDEFGDHAYIADDVNGWASWAQQPFELVRHLRRLIWLSVRTAEIVAGLPPALNGGHQEAGSGEETFALASAPHQQRLKATG